MAVYFDAPPAYSFSESSSDWDDWDSGHDYEDCWPYGWDLKLSQGLQPLGPAQREFWYDEVLPEEPQEILVVKSTSSGAYASLCWDAAAADCVAFDAEWVPDWAAGSDNPISVLQFAFPMTHKAYVIQLGQLGRLPAEVRMMLVNPEVVKVGFGVDIKDIEKLARTGISVTRGSVVDVQETCAGLLGLDFRFLGLRRAALEVLGYALRKDKRCTCSDWSSEYLSQEQVRYAALDAWVALRLFYSAA
eukprot:gb/GFBE01015771.1/.p1 GENE.gb/GFBE01015771.1/~~gb/GFBE01015771.1/.p1  ORF type:complete len:246 (+),score=50.08 gb/GFBE01015771.1/:1-738(+)